MGRFARAPQRPFASRLLVLAPLLAALAAGARPAGASDLRTRLPRPAADRDFHDGGAPSPDTVELGRLLFFDKVLSGNENISCATCHHPQAAGGDALSLPAGEGGRGLAIRRDTGSGPQAIRERVPRNSPGLFNLGAREFGTLFHDGRVEVDPRYPSGFRSPAGDTLPPGLANVLAAQAMFPVTSPAEMAGQGRENEIAYEAGKGNVAGPGGVWERLAGRLRAIPEYTARFRKAYSALRSADEITFVHAANAIAAFEAVAFRADDSPFDRFLRGDRHAMSRAARRGMALFYGKAGCDRCHGGVFQTDHRFHAIAMPQIGPGKGNGANRREDFGRERVTGDLADRYRFRTPSLRNVALTGPWGHAGAYARLDAVVRHHLDPVGSLSRYTPSQAILPSRPDLNALDLVVLYDPSCTRAIAGASELAPVELTEAEIADLLRFLEALTDPSSTDMRRLVPARVPSGLPVAD